MDRWQEFEELKPKTRANESVGRVSRLTASFKHVTLDSGHIFSNRKQQFPSFALFISIIVLLTLSPIQFDSEPQHAEPAEYSRISLTELEAQLTLPASGSGTKHYMSRIEACIRFLQSTIMNSIKVRGTKFNQVEAKVLSKMAKMWYIKKKLKKLGKKLKKHTIAVPVFTAIPIYEHSFIPPPHHLAHVPAPVIPMHHHHHAAAASSYSPVAVSQMAAAIAAAAQQQQYHQPNQQHVTSASNQQQQVAAYRAPASQTQRNLQPQQQQKQHHPIAQATHQLHHAAIFQPIPAANQIINTYLPSAPIYVDETGGLYGTYGNAYGRYDGGYQLW